MKINEKLNKLTQHRARDCLELVEYPSVYTSDEPIFQAKTILPVHVDFASFSASNHLDALHP